MININQLANKLEQILNGTYSEVVLPNGRPDLYFKVKTYGTMLDSVIDNNYKKEFIPVILTVSNGEIEAIKDSGLTDEDFNIAFFFPIDRKDQMVEMSLWLSSFIAGGYLDLGDETTSKVALNCSKAVFNQIENQQFESFEYTMSNFKLKVKRTDIYLVMEIELYTSYGKKGIEFGNAIEYELEIQETKTSLPIREKLLRVDSSNGLESAVNSQQIINEYITKGVISATTKSQSIQFLYTNSNLTNLILDKLELGQIAELYSVKIYKKYNFEIPKTYEFVVLPTSIIKSETIGSAISFTISFVPRAEIEGE